MRDHPTVADQLEWDSWPPEKQQVAKRILLGPYLYAYVQAVDPPPPPPRESELDKDASK